MEPRKLSRGLRMMDPCPAAPSSRKRGMLISCLESEVVRSAKTEGIFGDFSKLKNQASRIMRTNDFVIIDLDNLPSDAPVALPVDWSGALHEGFQLVETCQLERAGCLDQEKKEEGEEKQRRQRLLLSDLTHQLRQVVSFNTEKKTDRLTMSAEETKHVLEVIKKAERAVCVMHRVCRTLVERSFPTTLSPDARGNPTK